MKYHYQAGVIVPFAQKHYKQLILAVAAIFMASMAMMTALSSAATAVITPGDSQGWTFVNDNGAGGSGSFVNGPATPPLGTGSAQLEVPLTTDGYALANAVYQGLDLDQITTLSYSTYRATGGDALAIALQLNVDADSTDANLAWQGRLVYEPYHTQTVQTGVWETWDTLNDTAGSGTGNWWFSNGGLAGSTGCTQANPCTWAEVLSAIPNGEVHSTLGGVVLKAGSGWTGFVGNVDALTVNDDVYDFELDAPAPVLAAEEFATVDGSYKGISVGFRTTGFTDIVAVDVVMERADGSTVTKSGNQGVLDLVNLPGPTQLTAPFVIQEGTFTEAGDTFYWDPAPAVWTPDTKPVKVTINLTDSLGNVTSVTNEMFSEGAPSWPTYLSLLNFVTTKDECKDGGWVIGLENGQRFKNQGDCVSFYATGERNQPAGGTTTLNARGRR